MKKNDIRVDLSRGYKVMRGRKTVGEYSGTSLGLAMANAHLRQNRNLYLLYWEKKDLAAVGCAGVKKPNF